MGADRHNGILTSLLLLVAETINRIQKTVSKNNSKKFLKKRKTTVIDRYFRFQTRVCQKAWLKFYSIPFWSIRSERESERERERERERVTKIHPSLPSSF